MFLLPMPQNQVQMPLSRTSLERMHQEESVLDWSLYAYSKIQCKSPPPQPSFIDESQIIIQSDFFILEKRIDSMKSLSENPLLNTSQTDIVNDPFITRIMTGIHKLRPSSAKYQDIWDTNQVFKHLSTIKVIPSTHTLRS
ncbi:hypothetical protein ACTFIW_000921 [Dictyostelium discoideum]